MKEVKEKKCFKCEHILPIKKFYTHKKMPDGHLNKCIECTKIDVKKRENELKNNPEWIEQERERNREKYYRLKYKGKYKPTTEKKREITKRFNQKFPEKYMASKYTEIYLSKVTGFHLHHWSYNQEDWLDIVELSIQDHYFLHRYITYDQERMMYRRLDGVLLDSKEKHIEYFEECKIKHIY